MNLQNEKAMANFHDQMMELAYKNISKSAKEASDIAHMLLEHVRLPLLFRVHAHIVLASGKTDYLFHAKQAIRVAEIGREIYGPGKTEESKAAVEDLLWQANEALRRAERDMKILEDLEKRVKDRKLKLKKGEKILYGKVNGELTPRRQRMIY
ncbi:unnamed protein product [Aureobasidium uvarum]|uniref:Uncharacterized protein n=1 Tax=Aureobasidium uvarum TaxID=2773716 RepID=A0A9N8KN06_9PEZI|nr:unnamed protein product [Aureobasidium uvarum]